MAKRRVRGIEQIEVCMGGSLKGDGSNSKAYKRGLAVVAVAIATRHPHAQAQQTRTGGRTCTHS